MPFVQDTFTDTDGTLLDAHTPDVGGAWEALDCSLNFGNNTINGEIRGNRGQSADSNTLSRAYRNAATPASAEYDVLGTFVIQFKGTTDQHSWMLGARLSPTGTTNTAVDRYWAGYLGHSTAASRRWVIGKQVGSTKTELASFNEDYATGSHEVKFEVRDDKKTLYVKEAGEWVEKCSTIDNEITQVGRVGIGFPRSNTNNNGIDNFEAGDLAAGVELNAEQATESDVASDAALTAEPVLSTQEALESDVASEVSLSAEPVFTAELASESDVAQEAEFSAPVAPVFTAELATEIDETFDALLAAEPALAAELATEADEATEAEFSVESLLPFFPAVTPLWTLYIRGETLEKIAEIPDYQRADLTLRFNGVGTWLLDLDNDTAAAQAFDKKKGIIVEREGEVVLSGPVLRLHRDWDGSKDRLIVSGADDSVFLRDRIVYPQPGSNPPWPSDAHHVITGAAETVLHGYVDAHLGPGALAARQVAGLTLATDLGRGSTVTGRGRLQVLIELLQALALSGGDLGFRIIQEGAGIEFQVYQPRDQSGFVIFSQDLGNLASFQHQADGPEANHFIGGGGGELTNRVFVEKQDAASITAYRRIEAFRDRRDTEDVSEIEQTLDEEIAAKADRTNLSVVPTDTQAFAFMSDWRLGDKVTAVVDDISIIEVAREVNITLDPQNGERIRPVIKTAEVR